MGDSYIVLATNTNHDNFAFGPYSSYEDARTAGFGLHEKDHGHEYQVLQVFDDSKPLPSITKPPYEQDIERMLLHEMAEERKEELPPVKPAEQPEPDEEDEALEDKDPKELDLRVTPFDPADRGEVEDENEEEEEDERTLADLRAEASELDIPGRSSMNRDELIAAIDAEEG